MNIYKMKKFFSRLFGRNQNNDSTHSSTENKQPDPDNQGNETPEKKLFKHDQIQLTNPGLSTSSVIDPNEIIKLKLRSRHSRLSRHDYEATNSKLPLLVTIETEDIEADDLRLGLDLVLVIDVSSSMFGEKIQLVRETLTFILDELESKDRVCVIKFGSIASQITGFLRVNDAGKKELKRVVEKEITVGGCTDIKGALDTAFEAMLSREEANEGTAVFLLSDGEDTCGNSLKNIKTGMEEWHEQMRSRGFSYQIHSFGFGDEHDEHIMSMISNKSNGHFYYIKSNNYLDECFIDCFGYLLSVIASDVRVSLKLDEGFELEEVYSVSWSKKQDNEAVLSLNGLALGKKLNYITEIVIDKKKLKFKNNAKVPIGRLEMSYMYNGNKFSLKEKLEATFVEKETDKGEPDEEVEENYIKLEGVRVFRMARHYFEQGQSGEAFRAISNYHKGLHKSSLGVGKTIPTIGGNVNMENLRNEKDYMQVERMMLDNGYNPGYENFNGMNKRQHRMRFKKKGF